MKLKSESLTMFIKFQEIIERQLSVKLKLFNHIFLGGGGGELWTFLPFLTKHGISFKQLCQYLHAQNSKLKRKHRHIVEVGLNLLAQAKMPLIQWWDAFWCVVFIINRLPTVYSFKYRIIWCFIKFHITLSFEL